jgi:glyoxylase I family protein
LPLFVRDYEKSKHFYSEILGLKIVREVYREARQSYKLDLEVGNRYQIELFSFPDPPPARRTPKPQAYAIWLLR